MFEQPKGKVSKDYILVYQARELVMIKLVVWTVMMLLLWRFKLSVYDFLTSQFNLPIPETVSTAFTTTLIMIAIYLLVFAIVYFRWKAEYYEFFPDRVVKHSGWGGERRRTVLAQDFSSMNTEKGALGNIFNYGTISFEYRMHSAKHKEDEHFPNIPDFDNIYNKVVKMFELSPRPKA